MWVEQMSLFKQFNSFLPLCVCMRVCVCLWVQNHQVSDLSAEEKLKDERASLAGSSAAFLHV